MARVARHRKASASGPAPARARAKLFMNGRSQAVRLPPARDVKSSSAARGTPESWSPSSASAGRRGTGSGPESWCAIYPSPLWLR